MGVLNLQAAYGDRVDGDAWEVACHLVSLRWVTHSSMRIHVLHVTIHYQPISYLS